MNQDRVIKNTAAFVKKKLSADRTGHDWYHIKKVWRNARFIGRAEKANMFIVELGALLHDIADWKFTGGDETVAPRLARRWLTSQGVEPGEIAEVVEIVRHVSFKGAHVKNKISTLEGGVVQDADRLEALGAVGVARCFSYGGHVGHAIYDPHETPRLHSTFHQYQTKRSHSSYNHFYEKLLLLRDRMNTKTGKRLAASRHAFMKRYLAEFLKEWNGRDIR